MGQEEEELDNEAEGITFDPLLANAEASKGHSQVVSVQVSYNVLVTP